MNNGHRLRLCGGGFNEQDAQLVLHTDSRLFDWPLDGLFDLGKSMNREDIKRMAIEAGWDAHHAEFDTRIKTFAALVASAEREACAEICKKHADVYAGLEQNSTTQAAWAACIDNCDAIRARGQA